MRRNIILYGIALVFCITVFLGCATNKPEEENTETNIDISQELDNELQFYFNNVQLELPITGQFFNGLGYYTNELVDPNYSSVIKITKEGSNPLYVTAINSDDTAKELLYCDISSITIDTADISNNLLLILYNGHALTIESSIDDILAVLGQSDSAPLNIGKQSLYSWNSETADLKLLVEENKVIKITYEIKQEG